MDLKKYLNRINFSPKPQINKETLYRLQSAHLLSVPFENLDIHYDIPIVLDINKFYQKIVENKRGGFCYELNGLFNQLLIKLGFNSKLISARVHRSNQEYSPEYDHLAIIVKLNEEDILVDVGFGKFSFEPLSIKLNQVISDKHGQFIFDKYDSNHFRINEIKDGKFIPQYIFTAQERKLIEFKERCEFHQKSKNSHFTQKKVVSIAKEKGRITLNNTQLKISHFDKENIIEFEEEEFEKRLKDHFNIEINKDYY